MMRKGTVYDSDCDRPWDEDEKWIAPKQSDVDTEFVKRVYNLILRKESFLRLVSIQTARLDLSSGARALLDFSVPEGSQPEKSASQKECPEDLIKNLKTAREKEMLAIAKRLKDPAVFEEKVRLGVNVVDVDGSTGLVGMGEIALMDVRAREWVCSISESFRQKKAALFFKS